MAEIVDFIDKVKRYYMFTGTEIRGMIISILVLAFIVSFRDWGASEFDLTSGLINYGIAVLIVGVSLLIHNSGQRLWSLAIGYRTEYQMWTIGLFLGVVLAFITNGKFWLLIPGGFMLRHLVGHRLGWFRYDINIWGTGLIALAGPLATLLFLLSLKIIGIYIASDIIYKLIAFNVVLNVFSMLPIPPLAGSKIFFASRMLYAFAFPLVLLATILLYADVHILFAIFGSLVIAFLLWVLYYAVWEKHWFYFDR